jgi:hypothetical protein
MKILTIVAWVAAGLVVLLAGFWMRNEWITNPRVARELVEQPHGERARKVMLITLPSGRRIPVNYLRKRQPPQRDEFVYAGADGRWWRELVGDGQPVTLLVQGETLSGRARAVVDDPVLTEGIFAELRPNAIKGFGTLVEIRIDAGEATE